MTLAAYVTGHGFGHATRTAEVLRQVRRLAPDRPLWVVTSAPERLFRRAVEGQIGFRSLACDVGVVQKDALTIDEQATLERWRAFAGTWEGLVHHEAEWLRTVGARAVLGDIPPLAFAAAAEAGLPGVGLANFSWDWIYAHMARRQAALAEAADHCASAYARATLLLQLPFAGDLSAFPFRESIPLVARVPRVPRERARRLLGLTRRPAVLVTFGGLGMPGFRTDALGELAEFDFLVSDEMAERPPHVQGLGPERLDALGLGYEDVIGAADVVVTKPGYGIVSDAIAARTRLVYTERGDFPEYPVLVREMTAYLPAVYVSNQDLLAGRLRQPLREVLARPLPSAPDGSGASAAARRLLEL